MKIFYKLAETLLKYFTPKETEYVREKQMLMHPGESGAKLTKEYFVKKLGQALMIAAAGVLLSGVILVRDINSSRQIEDGLILRNRYGDGERKVRLDLYSDGEILEKEKVVTVDEKQYTAEEMDAIFDEVAGGLEEAILGENTSVDHIDHDLVLPDSA